jgi:branched-chain amino acid transport system substrate-binding protein
MLKLFAVAAATALMFCGTAMAQSKRIKIGFVSSFSGPAAQLGNEMRNGFELGLDHINRNMNKMPVDVIYEDDLLRPEAGKQKTERLIESEKVDFLVGYIWSNVLLPSLRSAIDSKTFLISTIAGPPELAGELCSPYVFSTAWQNDQTPEAMGIYMNQKNVKSAYLIGPNYTAGKHMLAGLKTTFKGQITGEEYTRWPDQLDFSVELSKARAARPEAIFVFYPGAAGVQFVTQYAQAGLKDQIPLYTVFTIDEISLSLLKEVALGIPGVQVWVNDFPNATSKKFVADYKTKYKTPPTYYAALSYDAVALLNSAVVAVNGDLTRKDDLRKELEKANFPSVRGKFRFGKNHMPIQNYYLQTVVKEADGSIVLKTAATIVEDSQDRFHERCKMN